MTAPLLIAGLGILFVIFSIAWGRMHAFFALVLAAMLVGTLGAAAGLLDGYAGSVEMAMAELGSTAGKIAFVIVAAAVIGDCMTESGAATRIVDALLRLFGEPRAPVALLAAGFFLSIPVFFDTVFILLLPLAREFARRGGGNFTHFLMAMCAGGVITHSTVPPTPGPLLLAEMLKLDLAVAMIGGGLVGIVTGVVGLALARMIGRRVPVSPDAAGHVAPAAVQELPSLALSLLPIAVPLVLIALDAVADHLGLAGGAAVLVDFLGNKNVALLIALLFALALVLRNQKRRWRDLGNFMGTALETAGPIVLITSAGGAFGAMIKLIGVGDAVKAMTESTSIDAILLAWLLAVVIRVAQGSATVAIITAGGLMMSLGPEALGGTHIFYVYLAIGYGSFCCSWMNDSGFWLVSRFGGFTEREALRSWTLLTTGISVAGFATTWVLAQVWPMAG